MEDVITKVFIKLEKIICLINEGDKDNDLVKMKRGKVKANMKFDLKINDVKLKY